MKEENAYNKNYIENFIKNQVEESLHLEYKSGMLTSNPNQLSEKLTKTLSSFANSDGGKLILGIAEFKEADKKHLPEKITPIDRVKFPKERIEQLIQDHISPKIEGLIINSVDYKEGHILIIDVPQSTTAHQARDLKYYRRMNFMSKPMRDYEIRDIMNRDTKVKLKVLPKISVIHSPNNAGNQPQSYHNTLSNYSTISSFSLTVENVGRKTAKYIIGNIYIPTAIYCGETPVNSLRSERIDGEYYLLFPCMNLTREVVKERSLFSESMYSPSVFQPIIPFTAMLLDEHLIRNNYNQFNKLIRWQINVDESDPIHGNELLSKVELEEVFYK